MYTTYMHFQIKNQKERKKIERTKEDHREKERLLWLIGLRGFICHELTSCSSGGRMKGIDISLIINSPQNGHSPATASSNWERNWSTDTSFVTRLNWRNRNAQHIQIQRYMQPNVFWIKLSEKPMNALLWRKLSAIGHENDTLPLPSFKTRIVPQIAALTVPQFPINLLQLS